MIIFHRAEKIKLPSHIGEKTENSMSRKQTIKIAKHTILDRKQDGFTQSIFKFSLFRKQLKIKWNKFIYQHTHPNRCTPTYIIF